MSLAPINYILNTKSPAESLMEGMAVGQRFAATNEQRQYAFDANERAEANASREQELFPFKKQQAELGLQAAELDLRQRAQQIEAQRKEMQRRELFQQDFRALIRRGTSATADEFESFFVQYPEMGQATKEYYNRLDERRKKPLVNTLARSAAAFKNGDFDVGITIAKEFSEAARNSGDAELADMADATIKMAEIDPETGYAQTGILLQQISPEIAKLVLGSSQDVKVQRSNLVGDGSVITLIMNDGTTRVMDANTNRILEGEEAQKAMDNALSGAVSHEAAKSGARREASLGADINLGREAERQRGIGRVEGAATGEAITQAPSVIESSKAGVQLIQSVIDSPALEGVTGLIEGQLPAKTQAQKDLLVKIDQIKGKAFLEAFDSLKGAGAITEREGEAATQAIARLDRAQSAEAFREALDELKGIMAGASQRAQKILDGSRSKPALNFEQSDIQFINQMRALKQSGQTLSPDQRQRLQEIRNRAAGR